MGLALLPVETHALRCAALVGAPRRPFAFGDTFSPREKRSAPIRESCDGFSRLVNATTTKVKSNRFGNGSPSDGKRSRASPTRWMCVTPDTAATV